MARITSVSDIKAVRVDLNADVGEECVQDVPLMRCITSANVACGWHAGSVATMRETIRLARKVMIDWGYKATRRYLGSGNGRTVLPEAAKKTLKLSPSPARAA